MRVTRTASVSLGAAAAVAVAVLAAGCGGGAPARRATTPAAGTTLTLGSAGRAIPRGFLGLSIEFYAIRAYTGTDAHAVNPVFEALVRNLSPGQSPVLRIGGDSTDQSWLPAPGITSAPAHASYELTPGWLATTGALAHAIDARMILGLNLAADAPALDRAEAAADARAFGGTLAGLEIGNEPNLYAAISHFRAMDYGPAQYRREIHAITAALPSDVRGVPLVGPALAAGPDPSGAGAWLTQMATFLREDPRVRTLSVHRYPLKNCYTPRSSPQYPTLAHLTSSYSTVALAGSVRRWVAIARAAGDSIRIDELNSAACRGRAGVSDTFAAALWSTDALFSLVSAGVDAVNVHTLPETAQQPLPVAYQLFTFRDVGGHWTGSVKPVYYGLQLFAQAAPARSRLMSVSGATHTPALSVWATTDGPAGARTDRLVLIDKDPGHPQTVTVRPPAGVPGGATVQRMTASSLSSTGPVTLGGRSYGASTSSGRLGAAQTTPVRRDARGDYVVRVSGASAALVTFGAAG
jgi:hypothetical protein